MGPNYTWQFHWTVLGPVHHTHTSSYECHFSIHNTSPVEWWISFYEGHVVLCQLFVFHQFQTLLQVLLIWTMLTTKKTCQLQSYPQCQSVEAIQIISYMVFMTSFFTRIDFQWQWFQHLRISHGISKFHSVTFNHSFVGPSMDINFIFFPSFQPSLTL